MTEIKIASALAQQLSAPGAPQEHRIIVRYKPEVSVASRPLAGAGARARHFTLLPSTAMVASASQVRDLAASAAVERIWPDERVHACLDVTAMQIRAPQVWNVGFTGRGVTVAVVDTGIDPGHPDFAGRILAMHDLTGEGVRDTHGHGTHVAGILAGAGNRYKGIAPEANLYVAKVLHQDGSGYMSEVMAGLEWAVQQGVQIINLSLGGIGPCDGTDALSTTCDAAVDQGVMVCVASGNYGPGASTVGPPGCARKVLTVGACSKEDAIATFSARGPTSDGRTKPDILMPGVDIVSCRAQGTSLGNPIDALYTQSAGTSMATPHAAGVCALLLEAFPELVPSELKARLMDTALDLGLDANAQGTGRGDAYQAYEGEPSTTPPTPPPAPGCLLGVLQYLFSSR
jgi:serine protease AprX